jgi:uncharacterized protein (DUF433 family)
MNTTIKVSAYSYKLLQQRAQESRSTPDEIAEAIIRLQLGNTIHIEQRSTPFGPQAYVRGTRVAVRHIAALLNTGRSAEQIVEQDLPQIPAAAIYEAIAYYHDHRDEVDAELAANDKEAIQAQFKQALTPEQYTRLTGQVT